MDFLRSSANENSFRERKTSAYGSLDRSWARRARSGSNTKKRPELLNIDFSLDRERPVSPANLDVTNRVANEDARPRYTSTYFLFLHKPSCLMTVSDCDHFSALIILSQSLSLLLSLKVDVFNQNKCWFDWRELKGVKSNYFWQLNMILEQKWSVNAVACIQ